MDSPLLLDMLVFVTVVDASSFTRAAELLGMSKSMVSKRITRLEKNLGVQLLYRSTRRLALTEIGETLYARCAQIKEDLEEAESIASLAHEEVQGTLRISGSAGFNALHLVPAVSAFMKLYPQINVEVHLGASNADIIEQGLDMAVRIGQLPDSNFIAKKLTERRMLVCAAPEYLEKHGAPQKPQDLTEHNCLIHHNMSNGDRWLFRDNDRDVYVPVQGNFTASSNQTLECAAVSGLGIAMVPGYMVTEDLRRGNLKVLLKEYCPKNIGIYALYPQVRHMPAKLRKFIDFLHERFQDEAYWALD